MESGLAKETNNDPIKKSPEETKQEDGKSIGVSSPAMSVPSSSSSPSPRRPPLHIEIGSNSPLIGGNISSGPESLISSPDIPSQTPPWSMISASPRGTQQSPTEIGHIYPEWSTLSPSTSQMKSPSVQTMGRPSGYDPNRIPASIFSSKPTNATEWSVASNESLFSIHMGNNSFSRENGTMFGKSGELPWLEEWNNSQANTSHVPEAKPNEVSSFPSCLPPLMEVSAHEESSVRSRKSSVLENEDNNILNFNPRKSVEEEYSKKNNVPQPVMVQHPLAQHDHPSDVKTSPSAEANASSSNTPLTPSSDPRLSNESGNSSSSFAFPVLTNEGGKPSSMKVAAEKPQMQSQLSKAASTKAPPPPPPPQTSSSSSWFSCFACWPRCC